MIKYGMNILGTIKNLFKKNEPETIAPINVEPKRLPKTLLSQYRQDFSKFDEFHNKHRPHQINALNQKANIPSEIKHTFEPIEIKGSLMINTPGNPGQGVELLKNGEFIRNITSMIHSETQRQIGGGKNKG